MNLTPVNGLMSNLRRYYTNGQTYFVTIVTHKRVPYLNGHYDLFLSVLEQTVDEHGANLSAWAILPDHCHLILIPINNDLSNIIHKTKIKFAARLRSQSGKRDGHIWQNRFWDHIIRNQDDMNKHIDYIHFNPVKHGIVCDPFKYRYSSASMFLDKGCYESDWGVKDKPKFEGEFGE